MKSNGLKMNELVYLAASTVGLFHYPVVLQLNSKREIFWKAVNIALDRATAWDSALLLTQQKRTFAQL